MPGKLVPDQPADEDEEGDDIPEYFRAFEDEIHKKNPRDVPGKGQRIASRASHLRLLGDIVVI